MTLLASDHSERACKRNGVRNARFYCADAGGIITLGFDDSHRLLISTMEPIDEIGSELKVKQMQTEHRELFEKLEKFDALVSGQEDTAG